MEFIKLNKGISQEWDSLIYQSDDGWLFSLSAWQEMITMIPEWSLEEHSFAVFQNGKMVAAVPLQLRPNGVIASTGWGMSGPVIASGVHPGYRAKILKNIYKHIQEIADSLGATKIEVTMSPLTESSLKNKWGVNPLIHHGFKDRSTHTRIIDLNCSEEELFASLSKDARYNIRKAQNKGYTIHRGSWPGWVDSYYETHEENYRRTGVMPHPKAYFAGISNRFGVSSNTVLWVAKEKNGQPVAFHNCARYKNTALYWTGCCKTDFLDSGVNYLLIWHAILGAKSDECRWYEMGECFPDAVDGKTMGLTVFKSKFGGELHRFYKGELILKNRLGNSNRLYQWIEASKVLFEPVYDNRVLNYLNKSVRRLMNRKRSL